MERAEKLLDVNIIQTTLLPSRSRYSSSQKHAGTPIHIQHNRRAFRSAVPSVLGGGRLRCPAQPTLPPRCALRHNLAKQPKCPGAVVREPACRRWRRLRAFTRISPFIAQSSATHFFSADARRRSFPAALLPVAASLATKLMRGNTMNLSRSLKAMLLGACLVLGAAAHADTNLTDL